MNEMACLDLFHLVCMHVMVRVQVAASMDFKGEVIFDTSKVRNHIRSDAYFDAVVSTACAIFCSFYQATDCDRNCNTVM